MDAKGWKRGSDNHPVVNLDSVNGVFSLWDFAAKHALCPYAF